MDDVNNNSNFSLRSSGSIVVSSGASYTIGGFNGAVSGITWYAGTDTNVTGVAANEFNSLGYKRPGARRVSKKKKGDKTNKNDISQRLSVSPIFFFKLVKNKLNAVELQKADKHMEKVTLLLQQFADSGQIALKDMLENKFRVFLKEQEMVATGFNKFISKEELNRFIGITKRKVEITPVKNFARLIPNDVLKIKKKADKINLFDEYYVVHTAAKDSTMLTEKEKKDPILFGTIRDSDKYYFVADWIDELCDLTFNEVIEFLDRSEESTSMSNTENELNKFIEEIKKQN